MIVVKYASQVSHGCVKGGGMRRGQLAQQTFISAFGYLGPWQFLNIGHQGPHARTSTAILAFHAQTGHRVLAVSQNPCFTHFFPNFLSKHKEGHQKMKKSNTSRLKPFQSLVQKGEDGATEAFGEAGRNTAKGREGVRQPCAVPTSPQDSCSTYRR